MGAFPTAYMKVGGETPPMSPPPPMASSPSAASQTAVANAAKAAATNNFASLFASLPYELVVHIISLVDDADILAWAMACKDFRAAQVQLRCAAAAAAARDAPVLAKKGAIVSPARAFLTSIKRAEWIVGRNPQGPRMVSDLTHQRHFCKLAARGGDLEILQALKAGGLAWDEMTCAAAAEGGHLEVLQWALEQGCPLGLPTCAAAQRAQKRGHPEVLQWLRELPQGRYACPCGGKICGQRGVTSATT